MKICNCTLPSIHGQRVCDKCANNNDNRQDEYMMDMIDINKYIKIAEDCGLEIISTKLEPKEKCEYCEVEVDDREALLTVECYYDSQEKIYIDGNGNITDNTSENKINYCPMCGREL